MYKPGIAEEYLERTDLGELDLEDSAHRFSHQRVPAVLDPRPNEINDE